MPQSHQKSQKSSLPPRRKRGGKGKKIKLMHRTIGIPFTKAVSEINLVI